MSAAHGLLAILFRIEKWRSSHMTESFCIFEQTQKRHGTVFRCFSNVQHRLVELSFWDELRIHSALDPLLHTYVRPFGHYILDSRIRRSFHMIQSSRIFGQTPKNMNFFVGLWLRPAWIDSVKFCNVPR